VKPKVIIYCDGACSPNPGIGGWAALLISPKQGKEKVFTGAEADTTNNRMELTAAIKGLEALKVPCEVDIHTDSQYSDLATYEQPLRYAEREGRARRGPSHLRAAGAGADAAVVAAADGVGNVT